MTVPALQGIRAYIDSLPNFPVDRSSRVFYGNTDATSRPLVIFCDLDILYERTSCGRGPGEGSFNVRVFTDPNGGSLAQAEDLSAAVDALLDGRFLSVNGGQHLAMLSRYQVITEQLYVFHVCRTYTIIES